MSKTVGFTRGTSAYGGLILRLPCCDIDDCRLHPMRFCYRFKYTTNLQSIFLFFFEGILTV